ncbi:Phospholipase D3 [Aphelenchoides bicaudatus]|nr:Phospholipase D3 [Aphelenchoides bicaudatus]
MAVEIERKAQLIQETQQNASSKPKQFVQKHLKEAESNKIAWISTALIILAFIFGIIVDDLSLPQFNAAKLEQGNQLKKSDLAKCYQTCSLSVVESVPQNLTILKHPLPSTFEAWHSLIENAKHSIDLAAYKSSLRGRHVLGSNTAEYSVEGDHIFDDLLNAGLNRSLNIRIVENAKSKDKGDNADGIVLFEQGAADRRTLNLAKLQDSGIMHSKFIITDEANFYLGSANLDWRSLNQKLEMGVYVEECPCLARELKKVFDFYWDASLVKSKDEFEELLNEAPSLNFNMQNPLRIKYKNADTDVYIATSPKPTNSDQTWDLEAIVHTIETAENYLYINVMDIFPIYLYSHNKEFWPVLDNAIRDAVLRGVHVKIVCAALHYPRLGLTFLKSLELINDITKKGSISIKIFKVPTPDTMFALLRRERRTHKKFMVSNSNWSGDYFEGTGVAIVVRQSKTGPQPFINEMRRVFERDFESPYAYTLNDYYEACINNSADLADFCEINKDVSFLETPTVSTL